jgi:hypothetical protein
MIADKRREAVSLPAVPPEFQVQSLLFDKLLREGKAFMSFSCTQSHQPFARTFATKPH